MVIKNLITKYKKCIWSFLRPPTIQIRLNGIAELDFDVKKKEKTKKIRFKYPKPHTNLFDLWIIEIFDNRGFGLSVWTVL